MRVVTPGQMRRYDELASKRYGIPSIILMENAGRAVAEEAARMMGRRRGSILCVCGKGHNGGDGFVAARHLLNRGFRVKVFCTVARVALAGDERVNADILERMGAAIRSLLTRTGSALFKNELKRSALIVDAIFGIGFRGAVPGPHQSIFEAIAASGKSVLAADIPSGLDALTGEGPRALKAARTVTFGALKTGLLKKDGPRVAGRITVADISIPRRILC